MCPARAARRASTRFSSCRPTRRRSARARRRSRPTTPIGKHLEDYPDGSASELREAIGRVFGLDPDAHRLRRRLRRSAQPAGARLSRRRRRGDPHHARLPGLSDRDARHRRHARGRAGEGLHRQRRRDPQAGDAEDQDGLPRQPEQSDRHLPAVRRGQAPAPGPAAACAVRGRRGLCRIRQPQRLRVRHRARRDQRERGDDAHVLEDPRARGAAPRLDVRPGACDRRDQPHPRTVQRQRAGDRGRHRRDRGRRAPGALARAQHRSGWPGSPKRSASSACR